MRYFLLTLTTLLCQALLMAAPDTHSVTASNEKIINSLLSQLPKAKTTADSIPILYNIFDAAPRSLQPQYAELLLAVAGRAHDYAAENDMLRQLAMLYSSDDVKMKQLLERAEAMPNSVDKHVTTLFISHQLLATQVQNWSEDERKTRLIELLTKNSDTRDNDIYKQIDRLYSIAVITGQATQGQLYIESLQRLEQLVSQLPPEAQPIRNQLYTALANIYTNTDRYELAIEADRKLLSHFDEMAKNSQDTGRPYRRFATKRYLCYRRMMSNYRGLSPEEVEDVYNQIKHLAATDPDVADAEARHLRVTVYYHMATKQYDKAIPLIQQMLTQKDLNLNYRRQALRELRLAAEKTGNDAVLLEALKQYTAIIDKYDSLRTADNLAELSVRYEVTDLRNEKVKLLAETRESEARHLHHMRMLFVAIIISVALIAVMFYLRLRRYYRDRHPRQPRSKE